MSNSGILKSSLAKKYWMGATGLFLCLFLAGHLAGNLQLLIAPENGAKDTFNLYGQFMTSNPAVKILSYLTYFSILFHAIDGIVLAIQNKAARPTSYAYNKPQENSSWASRNMAPLGVLVLFYIVSHMSHFWWKMHFGPITTYELKGEEIKDLYTVTVSFFQNGTMGLVWTLVYSISMIFIAIHLSHGFQSAFQSMGINHSKYTPIIKKIGVAFSIAIPLAFAIIPLYIYFVL